MGRRRQYLFVLLFVLGLVIVSALVISKKETKLGLDLQGGLELVYQGQPTGTATSVSGEDIEDSIEIIEKRINELGVSEPEVARLGTDEITVALPGVTDAARAAEQVGTTAQLYFYDWEPNLIGPEKAIAGRPGQEPPEKAFNESVKRWQAAGRNTNSYENGQLIAAGAYPTAYEAALLASEQEPDAKCENCSIAKPRYYLFEEDVPHKLLAGPEQSKSDLYISPTGKKLPKKGEIVEIPPGTVLVSEYPTDEAGKVDETAQPGWFAIKDDPALSGTDITEPEQAYGQFNEAIVTFNFTGDGQEAFHDVTRRIAQRGQESAIGPVAGEEAAALSGHFAVVLDNEVQTRPIVNFQENPDGIDGRTGAQISGGFKDVGEAQDLATTLKIGALPVELKLISETQVSATLGSQALDDGIKAGVIGVALVILFLLLYYRFLGLIASIALGAYGVIFFALIDLIPITLTLPGIAGLVLTIGVAADSNIVIFERIKEEVRAGRTMSSAIAAGYKRGIGTIIDANVVTLLTAFILFVLATAGVKGFAFTLGIGTLVSLLTAVVFTQALLFSMSNTNFLSSGRGFSGVEGKERWHFDFMGNAKWLFAMSGIILLIGSMALTTKGLNFGIDFESGTRIEVALDRSHRRGRAPATRSTRSVSPRRSSRSTTRNSVTTSSRSRSTRAATRTSSRRVEETLDEEYGIVHRRLQQHQRRADLRPPVADSALLGADLLAAGDLRLRGAAVRAEVRGAGADRDLPRHPDHRRRLLADRQRGLQRHRGRLPDDSRVLDLRHDHRLRPNTRERAADAAGSVLADRQPLDERGSDPVAGDQLLDHPRGHLAARLRRRDPAGLRLRDAGRDRLRYLLVDLHRLAGADRVEGT